MPPSWLTWLFGALGGTAYAAATIRSAEVVDNSLESRDLKDDAGARSQDAVNDNVTGGGLVGPDVRNNSLTSNDAAVPSLSRDRSPRTSSNQEGFRWVLSTRPGSLGTGTLPEEADAAHAVLARYSRKLVK